MEIVREERRGVLFYVCPEMREAGFPHGFSTRVGGVSPAPWDSLNLGGSCGDDPERVSENFRRFCAAIGTDPDCLVKNQQVHGDRVRLVTRADRMAFPGEPGTVEADGLMTREAGVCLAAFSADCIPVLLCDPVTRCIGAVHAGWRGTAGQILRKTVAAWLDVRTEVPGYLFGNFTVSRRLRLDRPLNPSSLSRILKKYCDAAGVDPVTPHDLRRTFATRLIDKNVDLVTVKNLMGHASITTTSLYDRRGEDTMRRVAGLVEI